MTAGPWMTLPSVSKRDPWQGQSQVFSAVFQETMQPRCVQVADTATRAPSSLLYAAALPVQAHDPAFAERNLVHVALAPAGGRRTSACRRWRFPSRAFEKPRSFEDLVES